MVEKRDLKKIEDYLWEVGEDFRKDMRVPARVYTSEKMFDEVFEDKSLDQLINTCTLPGVTDYNLAMPDMHQGYGMPIGGVFATGIPKGVISPGAVGFDENCLDPETEILSEFGCRLPVTEIGEATLNVSCVDRTEKLLGEAEAFNFFEKDNNPSLLKIVTESGGTIKVTKDHPLWLKEKVEKAEDVEKGDRVLVYPFKGVEFEEPGTEPILTEERFGKILEKFNKGKKDGDAVRTSDFLEQRDLLPLDYSSDALPYLLKIMGFVFGDAPLTFVNGEKGVVQFRAEKQDLEDIGDDIQRLGFDKPEICSGKRYGRNELKKGPSIRVGSAGFVLLLIGLGLPRESKTWKGYRVPDWIFGCPLWQKRLFLASFFGAGLPGPKTLPDGSLELNVSKTTDDAGLLLSDVKKLLEEFGIGASSMSKVRREGEKGTAGFRIDIEGETSNLIEFFGKVGYEYNREKKKKACWALSFLQTKLRRAEKRRKAGKKKGEPGFPSFEEYMERNAHGDSGLVLESIVKIEEIPYTGPVYDFTVDNRNHNFIADNFVVSNCGVRLLKSEFGEKEVEERVGELARAMQENVPSGLGRGRKKSYSVSQVEKIIEGGVPYLVSRGYGEERDVLNCEEGGRMPAADADAVSRKAKKRGADQVGTLGSGNHFLEIQVVEEVFDKETAEVFGLEEEQVTIMIHTGSRGFGHQNCTDYLKTARKAMRKYDIRLPDRQLACMPFGSSEGKRFFRALSCACNYAWANRQAITHYVRRAWAGVFGRKVDLSLIYDVAHNIAKVEEYEEGKLCVHRKGATRSLPPTHPRLPESYRECGQPVLIPGSMGTSSYVLVGDKEAEKAFFSTCHGAGRTMSRTAAKRKVSGRDLVNRLGKKGVLVKCYSMEGVAEEAPLAYKNVDNVVGVVHGAGLAKKVARLRPLAVIKGE